MKTRMEKYYDENNNNTLLREQKNSDLYKNINNNNEYNDLDYKLNTNVTVLDDNAKNIDVEHIKKILDTKYNETPKRKSINIDVKEEEPQNIDLDETREYDINAILEQARSEKDVDYEKERLKKVRDTQYDILNSLDLDEEVEEEKPKNEESSELMELINTITAKELEVKKDSDNNNNGEIKSDPLDILTDLKGSDDTIIVNGIHEEESINETAPIMSLEEADKIKPTILEEETKQDLTSTIEFTQSDFDDFNDLKKEVKSNRALIYVAIIIVSIILIAGIIVFLNYFLDLSLF